MHAVADVQAAHTPAQVERRDCSIGAELIAAGVDGFAHDVDVIVPITRQGAARMAFAFDRQRFAECSKLMHDRFEQLDETPSQLLLDLPEAHSQSVGPLLRSLIPPNKIDPLAAPVMTDVMHVAHWLMLDPERISALETAYLKSLESMDATDMAPVLNQCNNITLPVAADAAAKLLSTSMTAREYLPHFAASSLTAALQSPHLTVHEDTAWRLAHTWAENHAKDGVIVPRVFRETGLYKAVRWHALSQATFDACATQGFLSPKEFDEVAALRGTVDRAVAAHLPTLGTSFVPRVKKRVIATGAMDTSDGLTIPAPWRLADDTYRTRESFQGNGYSVIHMVAVGAQGITFTYCGGSGASVTSRGRNDAMFTVDINLDGAHDTLFVGNGDKFYLWPWDLAGSACLVLRVKPVQNTSWWRYLGHGP